MTRKIVRSITSWMLVFGLTLSLNSATFAADANGTADTNGNSQAIETSGTNWNIDALEAINKAQEERQNKINELMDTKDKLLSETDVDQEKLDAVEKELANLGVEKLSQSEAEKKINSQETKPAKKGTVKPTVDIPGQSNISWSSIRSSYYYNKKLYEIQHLYADPNSRNSKLKITGTQVINTNYNWKAGAMNLIKVAAGSVPVVGKAMTFYDGVVGTIRSIGKTTVIQGGDASYTYASSVRVVFTFVKPYGKSDDYQDLTYVSTSCKVAVAYNIPTFYYKDLQSRTVKSPDVIQGKNYYTLTPSGYINDNYAVRAYAGERVQTRATVNYINLYGLDNKLFSKVSVISPSYPIQLY